MKRKLLVMLCIVSASFYLIGCGNTIPEMSEEESAMVTEYAAGLLLKYDKNYNTRLVKTKAVQAEAVEETEKQEQASETASDNTVSEKNTQGVVSENNAGDATAEAVMKNTVADIGSFLELDGIKVDYQGYEVLDSYAGADAGELAFVMDAAKGAKLIVTKFTLTNTGAEDTVCDVLSKEPHFYIRCGEILKSTLVTMLPDDFSTLNTTIAAGESVSVVLVIEVKEEEAAEIDGMSLSIKYNGNSIRTDLQNQSGLKD